MIWATERTTRMRSATWGFAAAAALSMPAFFAAAPARASTPVGAIYACYACQSTGDAAVDAALAANPGVAGDGLLFEFVNTTGTAITGGTFHLDTGAYVDSYNLGTIAANSSVIYMPGLGNDGGVHQAFSLFRTASFGAMDTSDGDGGVNDASIFSFTGLQGSLAATSGNFTPSASYRPYRDHPPSMTSFVGDGPNGDGGCSNCYFGQIGTISVPTATGGVPEPTSWALMITGFGLAGTALRRRRMAVAALR